MESQIPVKVALRCRPLSSNEDSVNCITFVQGSQQLIIGDKPFTYDYVFEPDSQQVDIYENAIAPLVESIFKGYNATVLAYGQTGSGKTHTMGGGWGDLETMKEDPALVGVIPRVIEAIYSGIASKDTDYKFTCRISYMELYKEMLIDLLTPKHLQGVDGVQIREDINGPKPVGLKILDVSSRAEMLHALGKGAMERTTGSTAMNSVSSRSHAIFTIYIDKTSLKDSSDVCSSKFHLVDLAGSERAKRTKAEGSRFKEGVNINMGLLSLGNVISALGEEVHRHIPYRDSKLTRLLQDSLGGNSHTLMIACISPAFSNYDETVSCLRYANRARMIKNKPIVNRDPQVAEILRLKALVASLRDGSSPMDPVPGSKRASSGSDNRIIYDLNEKLAHAESQISQKQIKINNLSSEIDKLSVELTTQIDQNLGLHQRLIDNGRSYVDLQAKLRNMANRVNYTEVDHVELGEMMSKVINCGQTSQTFADTLQASTINDTISDIRQEIVTSGEQDEELEDVCNNVSDTHRVHALSQAKLARELDTVNQLLDKKQQLMNNSDKREYEELTEALRKYEEQKAELEKEVASIIDERDKLSEQLKLNSNNKDKEKHNILDQNRITALTVTLNSLRKRITEQDKMLKTRDGTMKKCEKLSSEIINIKHTRVRLMKQMKSESDTFRKWKLAKEHEITQFRAKDRKMNVQLTKINSAYSQQKMVMKRKTEEAKNATRRLKEALCRQSRNAMERNKLFVKMDASANSQRVKNWLAEEMEVLISVREAQDNLVCLRKDKTELGEFIEILNSQDFDSHMAKKRMLNSGAQLNTSDVNVNSKRIMELTSELMLKTTQIQDLEERLHEYNAEQGRTTKWDYIKTMPESKSAMKWLMDEVVASKVQKACSAERISEYQTKISKLEHKCSEMYTSQKSMATSLNAFTKQHSPFIGHAPTTILSNEHSLNHTPENYRHNADSDGESNEEGHVTPLNATYNKINLPKHVFKPLKKISNISDNNSDDGLDLNSTMDTTFNVAFKPGRRSQRFNITPLRDIKSMLNQTTIEE